jgi:hypothetical protein
MRKSDILWIIVDSARTYKTGIDDRDRLDIMDDFAKESVEFTNAYTSAPSSVLAASSMFTGLNSCFISRHFNDWDFDEKIVDSVYKTMKGLDYEIYSIFNSREERRMIRKLIYPISSKYFTNGISHQNWWTNKECTDIFINALNQHDNDKSAFYTIWYDCREDKNTSDEVERAIEAFKNSGRYENSIVIMCSDHGYPDPSTGLTEATMKKFSHDMIITEDNIKVPLMIKYPNCPMGKKVSNEIGSVDVFPTICEILNIPQKNTQFKYHGFSLLNLVNGGHADSRIARVDTRLNMADSRFTALIKDRIKYVYYWDQEIEELFNLNDDPFEVNNLVPNEIETYNTIITEFRNVLNDMEEEINSFHKIDLIKRFSSSFMNRKSTKALKNISDVLLTTKGAPVNIIESFIKASKEVFPNARINLLVNKNDRITYSGVSVDSIIDIDDPANKTIPIVDIIFFLTQNSKQGFIDQTILSTLKRWNKKETLMLDYNFEIYNRFLSKWIWPVKNYIQTNSYFYKDEPSLLFHDLLFISDKVLKRIIGRRQGLPVDGNKVKKMRDRNIKAASNK